MEDQWSAEEVQAQYTMHQARVDETRRLYDVVQVHLMDSVGLSEGEARLALGGILATIFLQDHELLKLTLRRDRDRAAARGTIW